MNSLPKDLQNIVHQYSHQLKTSDVLDELKTKISKKIVLRELVLTVYNYYQYCDCCGDKRFTTWEPCSHCNIYACSYCYNYENNACNECNEIYNNTQPTVCPECEEPSCIGCEEPDFLCDCDIDNYCTYHNLF